MECRVTAGVKACVAIAEGNRWGQPLQCHASAMLCRSGISSCLTIADGGSVMPAPRQKLSHQAGQAGEQLLQCHATAMSRLGSTVVRCITLETDRSRRTAAALSCCCIIMACITEAIDANSKWQVGIVMSLRVCMNTVMLGLQKAQWWIWQRVSMKRGCANAQHEEK
eukprot:1138528-Pelagomonas_calceolata.AAC.3